MEILYFLLRIHVAVYLTVTSVAVFFALLSRGGDGVLAAVPKPKRLKDAKLIKETRSDRCEICRGRAECEVHHGLFFRS